MRQHNRVSHHLLNPARPSTVYCAAISPLKSLPNSLLYITLSDFHNGHGHARRRYTASHDLTARSSPIVDGIHVDMNHLKKGEVKYDTLELLVRTIANIVV